jgi:phosphotransferase system  glucose/maltose/N-acetylglucosamine-specific IIC component
MFYISIVLGVLMLYIVFLHHYDEKMSEGMSLQEKYISMSLSYCVAFVFFGGAVMFFPVDLSTFLPEYIVIVLRALFVLILVSVSIVLILGDVGYGIFMYGEKNIKK